MSIESFLGKKKSEGISDQENALTQQKQNDVQIKKEEEK